jgi:hypothetical protein
LQPLTELGQGVGHDTESTTHTRMELRESRFTPTP